MAIQLESGANSDLKSNSSRLKDTANDLIG